MKMVLLIPFIVKPCTVRRLISFCPGARYDNTGFCSWHYDDLLRPYLIDQVGDALGRVV
jgi:hypothetical protein